MKTFLGKVLFGIGFVSVPAITLFSRSKYQERQLLNAPWFQEAVDLFKNYEGAKCRIGEPMKIRFFEVRVVMSMSQSTKYKRKYNVPIEGPKGVAVLTVKICKRSPVKDFEIDQLWIKTYRSYSFFSTRIDQEWMFYEQPKKPKISKVQDLSSSTEEMKIDMPQS